MEDIGQVAGNGSTEHLRPSLRNDREEGGR